MHKIFIDGREGTTGLQIQERLAARPELELCELPTDLRKDPAARKALINQVDFVITCLPDAAARESASLLENPRTRLIDPSSAHRVSPDFVYGFPELNSGQRDRIRKASRVSVPGCHATGLVAALAPLVARGLVPKDYPAVVHSLTGYSGGGKKLIATYETASPNERERLRGPRPYGLGPPPQTPARNGSPRGLGFGTHIRAGRGRLLQRHAGLGSAVLAPAAEEADARKTCTKFCPPTITVSASWSFNRSTASRSWKTAI